MKFSKWKIFLIVLVSVAVLAAGIFFALQPRNYSFNPLPAKSVVAVIAQNNILPPPQKLSNPPEVINAVYVTGYSAGIKSYLNYLTNLFKTTEINAVVVDIKDYSGMVSYNSGASDVKEYNLYDNAIPDIDTLVRFLHDQNIYVIGRIAVFEDPAFSKARPDLAIYSKAKTTDLSQPVLWQDNNGLSWLDPASKDVWDYDISLAKDAFLHGFDEINFDYVRFPSDGNTGNMGFPKWDSITPKANVIKDFFEYTRQQLAGEKISVDLFGQTTVSKDDMGIGQVIENAFENFDYVSPMVYPSHYANNFMGFANPAEHPYDIIKYCMDTALARENTFLQQMKDSAVKNSQPATPMSASADPQTAIEPAVNLPTPALVPLAKFRPWLQDFNMGADYTADMVKAEIQATQDALGSSFGGFMLWNPSNVYTAGAIKQPD